MILTLDQIKDKTVPIAREYRVGKVSVFGSYARGEATENSDVDLLIERGGINDLFLYYSFVEELEKALGCHVDVVMESAKDQEFVRAARKEGVVLYEE